MKTVAGEPSIYQIVREIISYVALTKYLVLGACNTIKSAKIVYDSSIGFYL